MEIINNLCVVPEQEEVWSQRVTGIAKGGLSASEGDGHNQCGTRNQILLENC